MSDFAIETRTTGGVDNRWLASAHGVTAVPGTLDISSVIGEVDQYGYIPGGVALGKITATGQYGLFVAGATEVQTVTITGAPTGGTFTLTFQGSTTAAIAFDAAASVVQSALEALSNVAAGDIIVTGANGGPFTLTFGGVNVGQDVDELTSTPSLTGGTTPSVTHATTTAGGSALGDGSDLLAGFIREAVNVKTSLNVTLPSGKAAIAVVKTATINRTHLPVAAQAAVIDHTTVSTGQFVYTD